MIDCYSIILCEGSVEDKTTNNYSIFSCIERVVLPKLGEPVPFHVLTYWQNFGSEVDHTLRVRLYGIDGAAEGEQVLSPEFQHHVDKESSARVRLVGVMTPAKPGTYKLVAESKTGESGWRTCSAVWYCQFETMDNTE